MAVNYGIVYNPLLRKYMEPSELKENCNGINIMEATREFLRRECSGEACCWYNENISVSLPGELGCDNILQIKNCESFFADLEIDELRLAARVRKDNILALSILAKSEDLTYLRKWTHKSTYEEPDTLVSNTCIRSAEGKVAETRRSHGCSIASEEYRTFECISHILVNHGISKLKNDIVQQSLFSRIELLREFDILREKIGVNGALAVAQEGSKKILSSSVVEDTLIICEENIVMKVTKENDIQIRVRGKDGLEKMTYYSHNSINFVPNHIQKEIVRRLRCLRSGI
jgi:hypothetical protein